MGKERRELPPLKTSSSYPGPEDGLSVLNHNKQILPRADCARDFSRPFLPALPGCGCCARRRLLTSFNTRAAAARTPGSVHSPAGRVIRTTKALTRGGPPARRIRTVIKNARTILSLPPPPLCSATAAPPFGIRGRQSRVRPPIA